jgi:hypothetical protein
LTRGTYLQHAALRQRGLERFREDGGRSPLVA